MDFPRSLAALLSLRNITRCAIATLPALCGIFLQLTCPAAVAQTANDFLLPVRPAAAEPSREPPDPLATMVAYQAADRWLRTWEIDAAAGLPAATSVAVTLRLDGEIIGRGLDIAVRPEGDAAVTALALRAAMREAEGRLNIPRDALYHDSLREIARRITISLELAGAFVPFSPRDWAHATFEIEPGVEGVAVRIGDRTAAMFPAAMLVTATEPASAYSALTSRLTEDPALALKSPVELAREHGVVFYRFAVSHIAQPRASAAPEFLHRGGKLYEQRDMTADALHWWAGRLVEHLWNTRHSGPEKYGSIGTWDPIRGEALQPAAAAREQAILALALLICKPTMTGMDVYARGVQLTDWVFDQAYQLAAVEDLEEDPALDPGAAAITWNVLHRLGVEPWHGAMAGNPRPELEDPVLVDLKKRCLDATLHALDVLDQLDPVTRHLVLAFAPREKETEARILDGIRAEMIRLGPANLPSALPWIGRTQLTGPGLLPTPFRDMRDLVWQHQLKAADLPPLQKDLAGAIVFTKGSSAMPSWHAARPLAFIATMLGDERFTEDNEVPGELARLLASLRFLRQLTAGPAEAHMYRNPDKAIGGVRASLWDQRMPPEATALTLITVCETIRSLEQIEKRHAEQAAKEAPQP